VIAQTDDATFSKRHQFAKLFVQFASLVFVLSSVSCLSRLPLCVACSTDRFACKDQEYSVELGRSCLEDFVSERKDPRDVSASEGVTKPCKEGLIMAVYRVSDVWVDDKFGNRKLTKKRGLAWYGCDFCGTLFVAIVSGSEKTESCGCRYIGKMETKNGMSRSRAYKSWSGMLRRCLSATGEDYENYQGRGIKVCERWNSFEVFLSDMGHPSKGESIDRIDVDGDYSPGNCRWATSTVQARNRRNNRILKIGTEEKTLAEWSEVSGVPYCTIKSRVYSGWSDEEAVFGRNACRTA
jgi:hypothetical protein